MAGQPLGGNLEQPSRPEAGQEVYRPEGSRAPIWDAIQRLTPPTGAPATTVARKKKQSEKPATEPAQAIPAGAATKTAQVVELLKGPGGAALKDIMATTNWQAHSLRGFISRTLGKKMGLTVLWTETMMFTKRARMVQFGNDEA